MKKNSTPLYAQQSSSNSRSHKTSSTAQNQRNLSASLGMSSDHSVAQPGKGCGSTPSSGSKKRKEPEQDVPSGPDKDADLDLSLEELESIMSEEMDEPLQITANKKQCLESGRSSAAINPQLPNQQKIKTNQQISASHLQLDRKGPTVTNQVSESQSKRSSNQAPNSELETHSLAIGVKRPETDVKEEEVSFEVRKTCVP